MSGAARIAIVTGAGSGIGRAVAVALATDGWIVYGAGRRMDPLIETAKFSAAARIVPVEMDVLDDASISRAFAQIEARYGRLDLLFNNAGVTAPKLPLDELSVGDIRRLVDTNLVGTMLCARAAMGLMKRQSPRGGRIINNGSVSALTPRQNGGPYAASKHAITGLTKSILIDGRAFGITCGQIDIGNAEVDRMKASQSPPEARIPVENVARALVYMASLPPEANIPFMTLMASDMPLFARG